MEEVKIEESNANVDDADGSQNKEIEESYLHSTEGTVTVNDTVSTVTRVERKEAAER